jgi:hypothetical protein
MSQLFLKIGLDTFWVTLKPIAGVEVGNVKVLFTIKLHVVLAPTPLDAVTSTVDIPSGKTYGEVIIVEPIL